jgi:hypothetical protein
MASRARFSLATMMLAITVCAAALAAWRLFIYEPPTHKIAAYEKAPGTRGNSIQVGPNRIGLRLVARNDRDGTILYDEQRSTSATLTTAQEKVLSAPAAWLDVVQIELDPGPELVDIIEVRIFDHEKRELLSQVDPAYGWRTIATNTVQLYGIGKRLPEKIDLWFRAHSYNAGDSVAKLAPAVGDRIKALGVDLTLRDIRAGSWSYHSDRGLLNQQGDGHRCATCVLAWDADPSSSDFQIAAVTKSGERVHPDSPHFLGFRSGVQSEEVIQFNAPLGELDHFEIRPFGGRERFFFEAVELPKTSSRSFVKPPTALVKVAGGETNAVLTEFAPLDVRIAVHRGKWATGTAASGLWASVTPADEVINQDKAFTVTYQGAGVGNLALKVRFLDAESKKVIQESKLPRGGTGAASGAAVSAGYIDYQTPLERIDAVEVTLGP